MNFFLKRFLGWLKVNNKIPNKTFYSGNIPIYIRSSSDKNKSYSF